MIWVGVALVLVSGAGGVYFGVLWCDYMVEAMRVTHKREMDEIYEEVRRLRAQVASLIGKE